MQKIMSVESLLVLNEYNEYAQKLLLKTISELTPEQILFDSHKSLGSVNNMLQHMKGTEVFFLAKCMEKPFSEPEPPEVSTILNYWGNLAEQYREFLYEQNTESLQKMVYLDFGPEMRFNFPVWQIFLQVYNHSMIHRGELSILLTELGHPLPNMDILIQFGEQTGQYFK